MSVQEVLSDVVALDYPFTPWNMLVLSDSKDAYTDAEWVPQVRTAKLPDLRTVVVRRLIVWLLCAVRVGAVGAAGARPRQGVGEAVYVTSRTVRPVRPVYQQVIDWLKICFIPLVSGCTVLLCHQRPELAGN